MSRFSLATEWLRPLTGANPEQRRGEPGNEVHGEVLSVKGEARVRSGGAGGCGRPAGHLAGSPVAESPLWGSEGLAC